MARSTDVREIFRKLQRQHPDADTEVNYENPYQLLVATILSAQSTDAGVNRVTPLVFKRYPNAAALAKAAPEELEPMIHSTGFFRAKAKALIGMARGLVRCEDGCPAHRILRLSEGGAGAGRPDGLVPARSSHPRRLSRLGSRAVIFETSRLL